jgi:hypothetical protein
VSHAMHARSRQVVGVAANVYVATPAVKPSLRFTREQWSPSCWLHSHTRHLLRDATPSTDDAVNRRSTLILSHDPLAAALLGGAVDLAEGRPQFANAGETPRDAVRRVRPQLLVVDCDDERSCTEAVLGPAIMIGARVILFRSARTRRDVTGLAASLGVILLDLPRDLDRLTELVRDNAHAELHGADS